MKLRYTAVLLMLAVIFGLFALAGESSLKNEFFAADSLLDADDLKMFEGKFSRDKFTVFDVNVKSSDAEISYSVFTENFDEFYIESKNNFDFTILCDESISEITAPWNIISYYHNCKSYNRVYSSLYDEFFEFVKRNTSESDFSSQTSIVNHNGLRRQNNAVTLDLKNNDTLPLAIKEYFSSESIAEMLNELYDAKCTSEQLSALIGNVFNGKKISLHHKRNIISGNAYEETAYLNIGNNIYNIVIKNNISDDSQKGSVLIYDSADTVDFSLEIMKNDDAESVVLKADDVYTEITADKDGKMSYVSKKDDTVTSITVTALSGYTPTNDVFDMSVTSEKNLMLCRLSPWLCGNADAALLFRTYEVNLEPLEISLEDLKINFDE